MTADLSQHEASWLPWT